MKKQLLCTEQLSEINFRSKFCVTLGWRKGEQKEEEKKDKAWEEEEEERWLDYSVGGGWKYENTDKKEKEINRNRRKMRKMKEK